MLTIKVKYSHEHNFSEYCSQYSYLFKYLYSRAEMIADPDTLNMLQNNCPLLDSWFFQSCKTNVLTKLKQFDTTVRKRQEEYNFLMDSLIEDDFKNKKERNKCKVKAEQLSVRINDNIVFGTAALLRENTALHNRRKKIERLNELIADNVDGHNDNKIKNFKKRIGKYHELNEKGEYVFSKQDVERLAKVRQQWTELRQMPITSIGEAPQHGNRKFVLDIDNNSILFKPSKNEHYYLDICYGENQKAVLQEIQHAMEEKQMPITIGLNNKFLFITYDEEFLAGYAFDKEGYFKELKTVSKEDKPLRKAIFKKHKAVQEEKKDKGKVKHRYLTADLNPPVIGINISDKLNESGDLKKLVTKCFHLDHLCQKLRLSTIDPLQIYQNNKRKHEIAEVWKEIFKLATYYGVRYFVMEDLDFKPNKKEGNTTKEFHRKTKNLWHRTLTTQLIKKYCNILGITLIEVTPCYSSFIGNLIYSNTYDPIAASLELARRGMVKFTKNSSLYPPLKKITNSKAKAVLLELSNQEYDLAEKGAVGRIWKHIYNDYPTLRDRNVLDKSRASVTNMCNRKSKVKVYTFT